MHKKITTALSVLSAALILTACAQNVSKDDPGKSPDESKNTSDSSTIKATEESSEAEESPKTEKSSDQEKNSTEKDNKAVNLIDKSIKTPAKIEYNNGAGTMTVTDNYAIKIAFDELGKMKLGKETDSVYDTLNKRVSFYDGSGKKTLTLVFNGNNLVKDDKNYIITDSENLTRIFNLFLVHKTREKSSEQIPEEPTPPHFRAYSAEDPYHMIPQHIIEPDEDELTEDPDTGKKYARNELIVVIDKQSSSEMIDQAASDLSADIIASHDETNRYQFRFDHDMSKQELEKAADKLKSNYSYITDAYLHYV